jgi:hypothetical protein
VSSFGSKLSELVHQRSFQVALVLWVLISVAALASCHGTMPLPIAPRLEPLMALALRP